MRTSVSFYAPHPLQIETLFQNQSQDMAIHYCNQIAVWSYAYEDYRDFCQKILWELYRFAKSIKYDRTKETLAKPLFLFYCLFVYFHLFLSLYFSVLRLVAQSTQQENSPSSRIHLCHLILMISISALRLFNAKAVAQLWGW